MIQHTHRPRPYSISFKCFSSASLPLLTSRRKKRQSNDTFVIRMENWCGMLSIYFDSNTFSMNEFHTKERYAYGSENMSTERMSGVEKSTNKDEFLWVLLDGEAWWKDAGITQHINIYGMCSAINLYEFGLHLMMDKVPNGNSSSSTIQL